MCSTVWFSRRPRDIHRGEGDQPNFGDNAVVQSVVPRTKQHSQAVIPMLVRLLSAHCDVLCSRRFPAGPAVPSPAGWSRRVWGHGAGGPQARHTPLHSTQAGARPPLLQPSGGGQPARIGGRGLLPWRHGWDGAFDSSTFPDNAGELALFLFSYLTDFYRWASALCLWLLCWQH